MAGLFPNEFIPPSLRLVGRFGLAGHLADFPPASPSAMRPSPFAFHPLSAPALRTASSPYNGERMWARTPMFTSSMHTIENFIRKEVLDIVEQNECPDCGPVGMCVEKFFFD